MWSFDSDAEVEQISFEEQATGDLIHFDCYDERDLDYLDRDNHLGAELQSRLIDMSIDDDVMSDEETVFGAQRMLEHELSSAIRDFQSGQAILRNL